MEAIEHFDRIGCTFAVFGTFSAVALIWWSASVLEPNRVVCGMTADEQSLATLECAADIDKLV